MVGRVAVHRYDGDNGDEDNVDNGYYDGGDDDDDDEDDQNDNYSDDDGDDDDDHDNDDDDHHHDISIHMNTSHPHYQAYLSIASSSSTVGDGSITSRG